MKSLRILPVTVIAMLLVFGLKLGSVWTDTQDVIFNLSISEVQAKDEKKDEPNAKTEASGTDTAAKADDQATEEDRPASMNVSDLSESEIEVLQRLVERRDALDQRDKELDLRDNLLRATETRIDEKISKLKEIESTIQDLLKTYDDQQLKKLKSLVSIYEKMKPKDAARIFNSLDMDVLLDVTGLMKESKLAAILGNMNGERAKKLTVELATQKQLPVDAKNKS
ncbi:MotE family protein [Sneathiella sp.]|jgi:flagellar motility protein MotE (MotC chaperone)|uniref:MotE family protein n=1 Tax=Sneathiella sp. TaxID=1964365 RepID=UPI0039E4F3E7